ncbi:MAG: DUF2855 family protein, partial [Alphaproteobacteria bacterium]
AQTRLASAPAPFEIMLQPGQVLFAVDKFALTANTITYAHLGERRGYWHFFETAEGWGRLPVWGFGEVARSFHQGISVGERFWGLFPMSTHMLAQADQVSSFGFMDTHGQRRTLHPVYNHYLRVAHDPAYDPDAEDWQALSQPQFTAAVMLAAFLGERRLLDVKTMLISAASSKSAAALAFCLKAQGSGKARLVGLTAPAHAAFAKGLKLYDAIATYGAIDQLEPASAVHVDFTGSPTIRQAVAARFANALKTTVHAGSAHAVADMAANDSSPGLVGGDSRTLGFFAPDHLRRRMDETGVPAFRQQLAAPWAAFVASMAKHIAIRAGRGEDAVRQAYLEQLAGTAAPDSGHVLSLWR